MSEKKPRRTRARLKSGKLAKSGIYERPDGKIEIGWRDAPGKQRWRVVEGGIKAAEALLAQENAKKARGERIADDPRLTFARAADEWKAARVSRLRPRTREAYEGALKHVNASPFFRGRLTHITTSDVAKYIAEKQQAGLKGWTIKGHLTVISSVFTYAGRHLGSGAQNPVRLLERADRPSTEDARPKRILSSDELTRLLGGIDDHYRLLFETAAETGCRLGETLGIIWENIDLSEQTIAFTHQLNRKGKRVPLKTKGSRRVLEITPALASKLRAHKLASAQSGPHDLVFVSRKGTGHDHRNIAGRVLGRSVKRAGLEAIKDDSGNVVQPAPTFHDLRHSHASALIAQGWDIAEVSARLGHSDIATTHKIYVHAFESARRSDERRHRLSKLYGTAGEETSVEATEGRKRSQSADAESSNVVQLKAESA